MKKEMKIRAVHAPEGKQPLTRSKVIAIDSVSAPRIAQLRKQFTKFDGSCTAFEILAYKRGYKPIEIRRALNIRYLSIWPAKPAAKRSRKAA